MGRPIKSDGDGGSQLSHPRKMRRKSNKNKNRVAVDVVVAVVAVVAVVVVVVVVVVVIFSQRSVNHFLSLVVFFFGSEDFIVFP